MDSGDRPLGAVLFPSKKARREGLNVESIDLDWKDWAILSCREEFPCRYGYNDDKRLNWTSYPLNEWQLRMSAMVDTNSQEAKKREGIVKQRNERIPGHRLMLKRKWM